MTDDTQPEAMDLADWLEAVGGGPSAKRCAALLREQHARIAELESELEAVGAGGVSGLLVGRAALSANAGEPVAHLWQHCETGRTRIVMPDMIVDADASWQVVGPLYAAPQPAPAPLSDDTKRLDWLDRNIFSREMSEWDAKYGHGPDYNMWVVFSPKGVQGSARNIIDAAIAAQGGSDAK